MFCMLKRKKYILLMIQTITETVKNKLFFQWFQTEKKMVLSCCKKLTTLLKGTASKKQGWFLLFELSSLV